MAANLTYHTMGDNREVDTSSFRQAIWNYIHSLYGIRHDDYDYSVVNQLLERNLKAYIKTLTCYPERLTKKEYEGVMREFKHSEKVRGLEGWVVARVGGLVYHGFALFF